MDTTSELKSARTIGLSPEGKPIATPDGHERIWLYFSGGGVRSGLGSLGVVFYLNDETLGNDAWANVTRVSSVSGGSLENAALANSDGDMATHFWHTYHRFTHHGGPHRYLPSIGAAAVSGCGFWLLFWRVWIAADFFLGDIVRGAAFVLLLLAGLQLFALVYTRQRINNMIVPKNKRSPQNSESRPKGSPHRLHVFSTTDMKSGLPAYLIAKNGSMVLAHDREAVSDRVDFYDAMNFGLSRATYASSAWPFVSLPVATRRERLDAGTSVLSEMTIQQHDLEPDQPPAKKKSFAFMDGGLTGTLGSRLDPALHRGAGTGVMAQVSIDGDRGFDSEDLRRIVIDGGQYLGTTTTWWLALIPGLSALKTTHRSIKVSLNSQITVDRSLADHQNRVWYVPVTGHGRHFALKVRHNGGFVEVTMVPKPRSLGDIVLRLQIGRNRKSQIGHASGLMDETVIRAVTIVEGLKYDADRVGTFRGLKKRGIACCASGAAGAFVEANGVGRNLDEMTELLQRLEEAMLQKGRLDPVLDPDGETSRWPTLDSLLTTEESQIGDDQLTHSADDAPVGHGAPFAISHRGETSKHRENTADAFVDAYGMGFRVLECDVQLTKDNKTVAAHGVFGLINGRHPLSWRPARWMTKERLERHLGDNVTVDEVGDIIDRLAEPIDEIRPDVVWNFEAKRSKSMHALLNLLDAKRGTLVNPPIISAGWRTRLLTQARRRRSAELTAAGFREMVRFALRRPVPHVAVVQLSSRFHWLSAMVARGADKQRVQVHWFGASERRLTRLRDKRARVGVIADDHALAKRVLGSRVR